MPLFAKVPILQHLKIAQSPVSSLRLSTCSTLECPALRTVPSRASLLSTKNQNGLRNQFHLSPYKPLTAQCESAPQPPFLQKNQSLTKPQSKNKPQKTHKTHFRDNSKKPQKRPRFQPPKPQKNTRANTPRVIFITSRTNLSINEKPTSEGSRHTTRDSRFQD